LQVKGAHALWLALTASALGAGAWLGCSSSSSGDDTTDGGTTTDGTVEGTVDVAADVPPPDTEILSCDNYCARVLANCTGDAAQYADPDTCKKICAALPMGDAGDTASDTVACRFYHAGAPAKQSPGFHCSHAGPFGGGVCGTRCGAFCLLAGEQCPQAFAGDAGTCDASCGTAFAFDPTPDAAESPSGPTSGNSLNCREYHLVAAFGDPTTHCAHVGNSPPGDAAAFPCK
jgi:hypothetical protein